MSQLAHRGELDLSSFKGIGNGTDPQGDNSTISDFILANPNVTQTAIIFQSGICHLYFWLIILKFFPAYVYNSGYPPYIGYLLFYNGTAANPQALEVCAARYHVHYAFF